MADKRHESTPNNSISHESTPNPITVGNAFDANLRPLRDFYDHSTLHNRSSMKRPQHQYKVKAISTMSHHLDAFDELAVGLQTLREPVDEARKIVVLLSKLSSDYELISFIVDNENSFSSIEVKEELLKEYERL